MSAGLGIHPRRKGRGSPRGRVALFSHSMRLRATGRRSPGGSRRRLWRRLSLCVVPLRVLPRCLSTFFFTSTPMNTESDPVKPANPNGVLHPSPGLARSAYPGFVGKKDVFNPKGVVHSGAGNRSADGRASINWGILEEPERPWEGRPARPSIGHPARRIRGFGRPNDS